MELRDGATQTLHSPYYCLCLQSLPASARFPPLPSKYMMLVSTPSFASDLTAGGPTELAPWDSRMWPGPCAGGSRIEERSVGCITHRFKSSAAG